VSECLKKIKKDGQFYIRWNGVGDLFPESVIALKHLNRKLPELPIWCVTRIPEQAKKLANIENIFVHFSLDKNSLDRRTKLLNCFKKMPRNLFFSYQCDKGEKLDELPSMVSVLFFDHYKIPNEANALKKTKAICPLNLHEDINGMCHQCRRCFNGQALKLLAEAKLN